MNKTTLFAAAGLLTFAVILLVILFQALVVVPQQEIEAKERAAEAELREERRAQAQRERNYTRCLGNAYDVYSNNWDNVCEIDGKEKDCTLPAYRHQPIEAQYETAKERCVDLYKAN